MKPSAPVMNTRRGPSATAERALVVGPGGRVDARVELVHAEGAPDQVPGPWWQGGLEPQDTGDPTRDEDLGARVLDRRGHRLAHLLGLDPASAAGRLGARSQLGAHQVRVNGGELDLVAAQLLADGVGESLH